jgi:LysR family transcriptional activator of mexEF-oprN operon
MLPFIIKIDIEWRTLPMNPLNFDMNLLVVLGVLMEERSVTRTGERLGRTQSAISNSLKRLRDALDDPLMVRGADGMVLTPKAIALQDQVRAILGMTQECLSQSQSFDPSTATGAIRMSAPDRLTLPVMLPLLKTLRAAAPGISVDLIHADREHALNGLDEDQLDVAVGWAENPPSRFNTSFLFSDFLTYVCRKDHPITGRKKPIDLEDILSFPHLSVSAAGNRKAAFDDILARRGRERQVAISVSNFSTVTSLLRESDLIGVYAGRVAGVLVEGTGLSAFRLPADIAKFDHYLIWHNRYDNDPRHQWLRDQIMAAEGPVPASPQRTTNT